MQSDQLQSGQSPFLEEIDTALFFPGGDRETIRKDIVQAILDDVPVTTLVGDEGAGKSHVCKMVLGDIPEGYCPVYFPESLESYEDVIRIVAQELDISLRDQEEFGGTANLLHAILGILSERASKLLLIYDQAEKIYLATLERIRKMLDLANNHGVRIQVILTGRSALLDNLQQLTLCNFEGTQERHFTLRPLNVNETYTYLNFCMNQDKGVGEKEIFTREATEKIFSMANGNFRMTNILAEEALQSLSSDTSFMVLLENVGGSESETSETRKGMKLPFTMQGVSEVFRQLLSSISGFLTGLRGGVPVSMKSLIAQKEWLIAAGGGGLVFLFLLMMVFSGEEEEKGELAGEKQTQIEYRDVADTVPVIPEKEIKQPIETEITSPERQPEPEITSLSGERNGGGEKPQTDAEIIPPAQQEMATDAEENTAALPPPGVEEPTETAEPVAVVEPRGEEDVVDSSESGAITDEPRKQSEPIAVVEMPEQETPEADTSVELESEKGTDNQETRPSRIRVEPLTSLPKHQKIPVLGGLTVKKKVEKAKVSSESIDKIYNRRIVASAKWWVGEQKGRYTIQLMALTSDQAEKNLKKILQDKQYRGVSDELYILRRTTSPLSVLVFYGEYETMTEARSASQELPSFLKKHQPYAISVAGAVKKASSG